MFSFSYALTQLMWSTGELSRLFANYIDAVGEEHCAGPIPARFSCELIEGFALAHIVILPAMIS